MVKYENISKWLMSLVAGRQAGGQAWGIGEISAVKVQLRYITQPSNCIM